MADGNFATLVSKDTSLNSSSNPIFTQLTDGSNVIAIDGSGNLQVILAANDGVDIGDVTINNAAGASAVNIQDGGNSITVDGSVTVSATDLDIRDLSETTDHVLIFANTAKDGTGTDYVPLVDTDGHLQVDILSGGGSNASVHVDDAAFTVATDSVTAIGAIATADSVDSGDVGALRMLTNRALVVTLEDAGGDGIAIDASGNLAAILAANDGVDIGDVTINNASIAVTATDLDIRDLTSVSDSVEVLQDTHDDLNANANIQVGDTDVSGTNPVPVTIVDPGVSSTEIHDYSTATVAGSGTDNHDYTVANTTFLLRRVEFAASGAMKVEVQTGPVASLATVAVGFIPKRGGNEELVFNPAREVPVTSTGTVRVIRTNREGSSQDVYSTIMGNDVS